MENNIKVNDVVSISKNLCGNKSCVGTVTGVYPNFITVKVNDTKFTETILNCDIKKLKVLIRKQNSIVEREVDDILDALK